MKGKRLRSRNEKKKKGYSCGSLLSLLSSATVARRLSYIRYCRNELLCWQQPHVRETLPCIKGCKVKKKNAPKKFFQNVEALLFPF